MKESNKDLKALERFMSKVKKTRSCWRWMASKDSSSYGHFKLAGKLQTAHRVAYKLFVAPIPAGLHCLHTCDHSWCVNPQHLWLGTHVENMEDMTKKGRRAASRGEKNGKAKLTEKQVLAIRKKYSTGKYTQRELAKIFNIAHGVIGGITIGKLWKHI